MHLIKGTSLARILSHIYSKSRFPDEDGLVDLPYFYMTRDDSRDQVNDREFQCFMVARLIRKTSEIERFFYQNLYQSWLEQWEYNINRPSHGCESY